MDCPHDGAPGNTAFAIKSLSSTETRYNNIEREALGILHGLEKFHYYSFSHEVNMITNYKSLVAMLKKDIVTPAQ